MKSRLAYLSGRRLKVCALMVVLLLGIKMVWVALFAVSERDRQDLLRRRAYLVWRLDRGDAMPVNLNDQFEGEWALVSHSMTAMALANLAFLYPETAESARQQLEKLVDGVEKAELQRFDRNLWADEDPLKSRRGHIGYLGHLNLTLAAYAFVGGQRKAALDLFASVSQSLEERMLARPGLNEETYPDQIYLADNAVVVASVALYHGWLQTPDRLTRDWCKQADQHYRDPAGGVLVFRLRPDGTPVPEGRGSGAGWNCFFLSYADREFALAEFARLKRNYYVKLPLGLGAIREWPSGVHKGGDVDSGPVIAGLSPSGTGFSVAGAVLSQDLPMFSALMRTSEVVGFSIGGERTHYLTAPLVGESIMLAMRTVTSWDRRFLEGRQPP